MPAGHPRTSTAPADSSSGSSATSRLDDVDLIEAKRVHLQEFLNAGLDAGLSPNTVHAHHRQLKAFYVWAKTVDYVDANPMVGILLPKEEDADPARMPVLTEVDYRAMLATCYRKAKPAGRGTKTVCDARDAAIMALLWSTGMRRGELAELEYRDIDWDEMTAQLRKTKGRGKTNSRVVPFDEDALHYLNRYMLARGNEPGPLFHSTRGTPDQAADDHAAAAPPGRPGRRHQRRRIGPRLPPRPRQRLADPRRRAGLVGDDDGLEARRSDGRPLRPQERDHPSPRRGPPRCRCSARPAPPARCR